MLALSSAITTVKCFGETAGAGFLAVSTGRRDRGETPTEAMFRELYEELGLRKEQVEIVGQTRGWLRYRIPLT